MRTTQLLKIFSRAVPELALIICVAKAARAQTPELTGTISTYAGIGVAINPSTCGGRFPPCPNQGPAFGGDGGPAIFAAISKPFGIAVDANFNLFIADTGNNRVRKVTPDGVISTVAGNGNAGFSGDGGPADVAALMLPQAVAVDAAGNIFIADTGNARIRKVTTDGAISTVAGTGIVGYSGDGGPAVAAEIETPYGVAVDSAGNVFIAGLHIRRVTSTGVISTVTVNGTALSGEGVAADLAGNLFVADAQTRVWRVTPAGSGAIVAGNGTTLFSGDGGPATAAGLSNPTGVAIDAAGDLFIADFGNRRIRKVTSDGNITTVAGNGTTGYNGVIADLGPAVLAALNSPSGIAADANGSLFIADENSSRIRKVTFGKRASVPFNAGAVLTSMGAAPTLSTGYGAVFVGAGTPASSGIAIVGNRGSGVLISEAGVPASPLIQSGRIFADIGGAINTGIALANPNPQAVAVSFFFTDSNGNNIGEGSISIAGGAQINSFLTQPPFNAAPAFTGTFTFTSSLPIAAVALRGRVNERSELLMTTLPVTDLNARAFGPAIFPHFVDGGGWFTEIALVNPSDAAISGTLQFLSTQGVPEVVVLDGQRGSSFSYSLAPRSFQRWQTSAAGPEIESGSIRAIALEGTAAPAGVAVFGFRRNGIETTEAGVPASPASADLRIYAETGSVYPAVGSTESGFAITNLSPNSATVTVELDNLDGSPTGRLGSLSIPGNGQTAMLLNQIPGLESVPAPFQGTIRIQSADLVAITGLRIRVNERSEPVITTTPPTDEMRPGTNTALFFPHIVDSGGFTTQFILFSGGTGSSGVVQLFSSNGAPMNISLE